MPRSPLSLRRLLLVAAALAAGALALAAWGDRRAPRELLPEDAALAVELRGAAALIERIEGTRFAAALAAGPTYAWLERSETVRAIDELRAAIGRATGFTPQRRHLLDLVGSEAAAAWYAPAGTAAPAAADAAWLAAGRLSLRAWALAAASRVALRFGRGSGVSREQVAGATVFTVGAGRGALHLFASGRLLVAGSDRELVRRAARLAAGEGAGLAGSESWRRVAAALPGRGTLRVLARGDQLPQWLTVPARGPARAAGAVLTSGAPVTIDLFVDAPGPAPRPHAGAGALPKLVLAGPAPLLFHASAGPLPRSLVDLLEARSAAVARRDGAPWREPPAPSGGFALALTSLEEGGLFPRPHAIVGVGMRDADAARQALRLLFPAGARSAAGRWGTTLSTRESLPLAGEFELWGAAAGDRLVLATQRALIESLESAGSPAAAEATDPGAAPPDTLSTLDVAKLLPAARRYAAPAAGLLRARRPGLPDVSRDFELLAAVRTLGIASGTTQEGVRTRITLQVGDLPSAP